MDDVWIKRSMAELFLSQFGQFWYYEEENYITIVHWNNNDENIKHIVVPEAINEKPVIIIEPEAFSGEFDTIVLPSQLEKIGYYAFNGCELRSVSFPDGLMEIGSESFTGNDLNKIEIPDSVIKVGRESFQLNRLENVTLSINMTEIDEGVFQNNNIQTIIIPDKVMTIKSYAFVDNPLREIIIGSNVQLDKYSFEDSRWIEEDETSFYFVYNQNNKKGGRYIKVEIENEDYGNNNYDRTYNIWEYHN
jgi:hypothetical protein